MAEIQPGGGVPTPPSLADLDDPNFKPTPPPAPPAPPAGGEPAKTPEQIAAETKAAEEAKAAEEKAAAEAKAAEEAAKAAEGEEEVTDDEADAAFIESVNKLHGFDDFKVEYPEGLDPLSPEGIHHREKALMEYATNSFDEYLKQKDPRGYAYMLHRQNGGTDEDFFAKPTNAMPDYETFKTNVDLQKQVYTSDLRSKGVDEDLIKAQVEKLEKDGKLFEKSDAIFKAREQADKDLLDRSDKAAKARAAAEEAAIRSTVSTIDDIVNNSKLDNIVIPDAKRAEFGAYLKEHLFFDGEQFFINKPISKETLAKVIQGEYFSFVGGDLKALVERKAKTEVTKGLRIRTQKTQTTPKSGDTPGSKSGFVALGDL